MQKEYINKFNKMKSEAEKENNQYITLTKEQEKERIELINLWSKKAPGDKEKFLQ